MSATVPAAGPGGPYSAIGAPFGPLIPSFPAWGLTWRSIVSGLGVALVVTAPWAGVWYYKWFAERVALPGGRPLRLDATVGNSWFLFVAFGLLEWLGAGLDHVGAGAVSLLLFLLQAVLGALFLQWFCANLRTDDRSTRVAYQGGYIRFVGWGLLFLLSIFTVIGWAWVLRAQLRWVCRNISGTPALEFNGTGFGILWRSIVLVIGAAFIITIPITFKWWTNWFVSQFSTSPVLA
jgi:hypothetical protein